MLEEGEESSIVIILITSYKVSIAHVNCALVSPPLDLIDLLNMLSNKILC